MARKRIEVTDKNLERNLNTMFKELYDRTTFLATTEVFGMQYQQASTLDEKVDVIARYLGL